MVVLRITSVVVGGRCIVLVRLVLMMVVAMMMVAMMQVIVGRLVLVMALVVEGGVWMGIWGLC